jgi:hypothetical protein
MMGAAFLPWEQWIAWLIHAVAVAVARRLHEIQRKRCLTISAHWPQAEGIVEAVNWDGSYPREEVAFSYSTERGYYSGCFWRWFEKFDMRQVRVGDPINLRYSPDHHDRSVFLDFPS